MVFRGNSFNYSMTATASWANRSASTHGSFWADEEVKALIKIWGRKIFKTNLMGPCIIERNT